MHRLDSCSGKHFFGPANSVNDIADIEINYLKQTEIYFFLTHDNIRDRQGPFHPSIVVLSGKPTGADELVGHVVVKFTNQHFVAEPAAT